MTAGGRKKKGAVQAVAGRGLHRRPPEKGWWILLGKNRGSGDCIRDEPCDNWKLPPGATNIPWGGGDGVISLLDDRLLNGGKALILVIGAAPADTLSARTGVTPCNCFSKPLRKKDLLDRIGTEFSGRLPRGADDGQRPSEESMTRPLMEEDIR